MIEYSVQTVQWHCSCNRLKMHMHMVNSIPSKLGTFNSLFIETVSYSESCWWGHTRGTTHCTVYHRRWADWRRHSRTSWSCGVGNTSRNNPTHQYSCEESLWSVATFNIVILELFIISYQTTDNVIVCDRVKFRVDVHVRWSSVSLYTLTVGRQHKMSVNLKALSLFVLQSLIYWSKAIMISLHYQDSVKLYGPWRRV